MGDRGRRPARDHGDMSRISRRVGAITESATLAVDAKAKALQAAGEDVIGFGAGEPDFPTPAHIVAAAAAACADPRNHKYTPDAGPARAARRDRGEDRCATPGYAVEASQVVVTNGGKHAVYNAFQTLLDPGDEVHHPRAVLDHLPRSGEARRRRAGRGVRPGSGRVPGHRRAARSRAHAAHEGRCCSCRRATRPARSTRATRSRRSGAGRVEHGIWVLTDEIYEHLTYGGHEFSSMPVRRARARRHLRRAQRRRQDLRDDRLARRAG